MKILITTGGTSERIDKVRKITNDSTGEMGLLISEELLKLKDVEIFYLNAGKSLKTGISKNNSCLWYIDVTDTQSVLENMKQIIKTHKIDYVIHAMAISDYKVEKVFSCENIDKVLTEHKISNSKELLEHLSGLDNSSKISSNMDTMFIQLTKTPKIIDLIKEWDKDVKLISFKLLSNVNKETLIDAALKQKERTGSEVVVGNSINDNGMYEAYWVENQEAEKLDNKKAVANKIFKYIKRDNG